MSKWAKIDPKAIAQECSQRHVQSVLEDAQRDIALLSGALKDLVDRPIRFTTLQSDMVTTEGSFTHQQITQARDALARATY